MSIDYSFVPLVVWPGQQTSGRKRAPFRSSYSQTVDLLDRELRHLNARQVVIQLALQPSDIRLDGRPRAGSRPSHPGVILTFRSAHGPLSYPCDRYDDWESNLRAIALSLECLRTVDRYGVTKTGEQYKGWKQLPPPGVSESNGLMSVDEAAKIVRAMGGGLADEIKDMHDAYRQSYRRAAQAVHPDAGGKEADFIKLQKAAAVLDKHHGVV